MGKRVTTKEAAQITGISEYSLTGMRKRGLLPYIKIGYGKGRILYDIDLLQEALEKQAKQNMEEQSRLYAEYEKERYPEFNFKGSILG